MNTQKSDVTKSVGLQRTPRLSVRLKINDDNYTLEPLAKTPGAFRVTRPPRTLQGEDEPVSYVVRLHGERKVSCTCPDAGIKRNRCKHIFGVLRLMCVFAYAAVGQTCPPADKLFPAPEEKEDAASQTFIVVSPDAPAFFSYVDEDSAHDTENKVLAGHGQHEAG